MKTQVKAPSRDFGASEQSAASQESPAGLSSCDIRHWSTRGKVA